MSRHDRRRVLRTAGAALVLGLAGCMGDEGATPSPRDEPTAGGGTTTTAGPETTAAKATEGTPTPTPKSLTDPKDCGGSGVGENGVRVANLVPDADAISVTADGSNLLDDIPYTGVCGRKSMSGDTRITVSAGGDSVFDDTVSLSGSGPRTLVIAGEIAEDGKPITPVAFSEFATDFVPGNGSAFQVVHAVPDAPRLLVQSGGAVNGRVDDGIGFGEAALPQGDRDFLQTDGGLTLADAESGDPLARFDGTFAPATIYTLFIGGYLTPDDDAGGVQLAVVSTARSV